MHLLDKVFCIVLWKYYSNFALKHAKISPYKLNKIIFRIPLVLSTSAGRGPESLSFPRFPRCGGGFRVLVPPFARPLFFFPSGVQYRAVLAMEPSSLRSTCPIHRQWLLWPCLLVCSGVRDLVWPEYLEYSPEVLLRRGVLVQHNWCSCCIVRTSRCSSCW